MIAEIEREVEFTQRQIGKKAFDPRVMAAMRAVPREKFVPAELKPFAYDNGPLPIGNGQTISQPYIVALMTDLLQLEPEDIVLEIGTGSGYQTAILTQLVKKVFTVEYIRELGEAAAERLRKLNYTNFEMRIANGYEGWPEHAPYDAVIVTAAATHIPPALVEQLKPGGRMVIPVGLPYMHQELMLLEKDENGKTSTHDILAVAFVPLQEEKSQEQENGK